MKNEKERKGRWRASTVRVTVWLLALGSMSAWVWQGSENQTSRALYQQAVHEEEAVGNAPAAIELYRRVIAAPAGDRVLAAKAELRLAALLAKVGRSEEAQTHYENIVASYGGDPALSEIVTAAQEKLGQPRPSGDKSRMVVRRVWAAPNLRLTGAVWHDRYVTFADPETGDLAIRDLATGKNRRLTHNQVPWEEARHAHISPDGKWVAYSCRKKDGSLELRIIGLDGSQPHVLYRHEEVTGIDPDDWSRDGKHILAIFRRKDGTRQIGTVSVADGSVRVLKSLNWGSPETARFSPDGRYIAYDFAPNQDSKQEDIALLATDGSREIPLVEHPADDDLMEWAPNGKSVLFRSDRTGTEDLWVIRVADGKPQGSPQLVKKNIGSIDANGMSPKGSLYYRLKASMKDAYIATLDPTNGQVLAPPKPVSQRFVGNTARPDWSPDGKYLAYTISLETGSRRIAVRSTETGEERYFSPDNVHSPGPRWSPDGRSILIGIQDREGRPGLYQMDTQTGDLTPIVLMLPRAYALEAAWSRDGKEIFYTRSDPKRNSTQIVRRNLETGQEIELQADVSPALALSPDGRRLAFLVGRDVPYRPTTLKVMRATGGEPQELFRVQRPEFIDLRMLAWTPDGRYLLVGKRSLGALSKRELWRIPGEGGKPQKLEFEMEHLSGLRVHPDGRRIAFTALGQQELWAMENFLPALRADK
ncbi:hypothetical protein MYX65_10180 [Acidobacteria bacterium AH-259-L09]|nr:hypothetical protein [Acidobacteria bacterium AH-259-L09]